MNPKPEFSATSNVELPTTFHPSSGNSFPIEAIETALLNGSIQELLDDLPQETAILDGDCSILAVNRAWREIVEKSHRLEALPGDNYLALCAKWGVEGYEPSLRGAWALKDLRSGKIDFWQLIYNGGEHWHDRDFQICFHRISYGDQFGILVTRFDLTEIMELRRAKDELSNSLIESQTLERQRLARELHDSASQCFTGIGLVLARLEGEVPNTARALVTELRDLLGEAHRGIRSISYLAHPPRLEDLGLIGATESLVNGMARRADLSAFFEVKGTPVAVSAVLSRTLYRIVQESVSNVYRHSKATTVSVELRFRSSAIHLMIVDDGVGISSETLAGAGAVGVGLASMRARLSEVGGRLIVRRLLRGTAILASVPLQRCPIEPSAVLPKVPGSSECSSPG